MSKPQISLRDNEPESEGLFWDAMGVIRITPPLGRDEGEW